MDPDSSYQLFLLVILLCFSASFSAAETALLSVKKHRLRSLVTELELHSVMVNKMMSEPERFFETIQVGGILVKFGVTALGVLTAYSYWQFSRNFYVFTAVLAFLVLSVGEIIPRAVAARDPEKTSCLLNRFVYFFVIVLWPLVKLVYLTLYPLARLLGVRHPSWQYDVTEEEIINLVAAGQEDGLIHQEETTMIHGVFEFTDTVARDVMVPRPDIVAMEKESAFNDVVEVIKAEQFSRMPVYETSIDNILGVVHIKDLFMSGTCQTGDFHLTDYLRQTLFVPETKKVNDLFKTMKKEKIHMAIVLDEYGSTAGLVTMEDLIEEIMGDIQDEHDFEEPEFQRIDADTVLVNASLRIDEVNEKLGLALECEKADTVGGLVFAKLDRVPAGGDKVQLDDIELTVEVMEGHRIEKVRLKKLAPQQN